MKVNENKWIRQIDFVTMQKKRKSPRKCSQKAREAKREGGRVGEVGGESELRDSGSGRLAEQSSGKSRLSGVWSTDT